MKRFIAGGFIALVAVVAIASVAFAGVCPTDWTLMLPDGRIYSWYISSATDLFGRFGVEYGRSYCFEAFAPDWGDEVYLDQLKNNSTCGSDSSVAAQWINRGATVPEYGGSVNTRRRCGIMPNSESMFFRVRSTFGSTMDISATETTLFNPRWSTYGGYVTSWGVQNTTPSSLNGQLTVYDGTNYYTYNTTLPAMTTTFISSSATFNEGLIGSNKAGNAWFAHDGPPGAVRGDCYFMNSAGVLIPSSLEPVRQNRGH